MIGMACENRRRAVDLLGKNDAGKAMRQGHGAERDSTASALANASESKAVGAPDQEGDAAWRPVAILGQESARNASLPSSVTPLRSRQISSCEAGTFGEQRFRFGLDAGLCGCGLAIPLLR